MARGKVKKMVSDSNTTEGEGGMRGRGQTSGVIFHPGDLSLSRPNLRGGVEKPRAYGFEDGEPTNVCEICISEKDEREKRELTSRRD